MPEIQLSWQQGFSLVRKPVKKRAPRRKRQQRFEFVEEDPQETCLTRRSPFATKQPVTPPQPSREHAFVPDSHECCSHGEDAGDELSHDLSIGTWNSSRLIMSQRSPGLGNGTAEPYLNPCSSEDESTSSRLPELAPSEHTLVLLAQYRAATARNGPRQTFPFLFSHPYQRL
ncbi:hypothetical protein ONS95_001156 [Cadophora gregata]|uniref:uncharacterized protein n=1 Tax=Cadophora gregata TaxID=51156 RepID=UPI0026DB920A|nr:uncharacterized protein ONS95_001156 [Cadophora gregata]KAK0129221.1 hypothetical protein ONS95_001156 [Cadophora gregata]